MVPVVELSDDLPQGYGPDRAVVVVRLEGDERLAEWVAQLAETAPSPSSCCATATTSAAEFIRWEHAVALLGPLLGVNPFGQPNVQAAKDATDAVLAGELTAPAPHIEHAGRCRDHVRGGARGDPGTRTMTLATALGHALAALRAHDYLGVLAYLPDDERAARAADARPCRGSRRSSARRSRSNSARATCTPPGSCTRAAPNTGVFLLLTTRDHADAPVPGQALVPAHAAPRTGRGRPDHAGRGRAARAARRPARRDLRVGHGVRARADGRRWRGLGGLTAGIARLSESAAEVVEVDDGATGSVAVRGDLEDARRCSSAGVGAAWPSPGSRTSTRRAHSRAGGGCGRARRRRRPRESARGRQEVVDDEDAHAARS